jgi:seryl-tRNA synthetase
MTQPIRPTTEEIAKELVKELNDCIEQFDSGGPTGDWHEAINSDGWELIEKALDSERTRYEELERENARLSKWLNEASTACGSCDIDSVANVVKDLQASLTQKDAELEALRTALRRIVSMTDQYPDCKDIGDVADQALHSPAPSKVEEGKK